MAYNERKELIMQLEECRQSKIITLIISDRVSTVPFQGINAQIAPDQVPQIIEHLKMFVEKGCNLDKIELLLYSRGGDINTAWQLVNTIRNYTPKFNVLIPVHAHSSATLISLGANEIVMTKTASLSPVDPTVANAFNPKENNASLGISVEDVTSFFNLAKDKDRAAINGENNLTEVFKSLVDKVHPLALGNVKRSHTQIRLLSKKLLGLHLSGDETSKIDGIVDELTEKLYTHYHLIYREEAKNLGLSNVVKSDGPEEELLWKIYKDYESEMKLKEIFDLPAFMGVEKNKEFENTTILIESTESSSAYKIKQTIKKILAQDYNHRLQVAAAMSQYSINAANLKTQISQIRLNASQVAAQITSFIQQGNQQFAGILSNLQAIENQTSTLINSIANDLDITDLQILYEGLIQKIGWS